MYVCVFSLKLFLVIMPTLLHPIRVYKVLFWLLLLELREGRQREGREGRHCTNWMTSEEAEPARAREQKPPRDWPGPQGWSRSARMEACGAADDGEAQRQRAGAHIQPAKA